MKPQKNGLDFEKSLLEILSASAIQIIRTGFLH